MLLEIPPFGGDVVNVLEHATQQRVLMAHILGFIRQDGSAVHRQAKKDSRDGVPGFVVGARANCRRKTNRACTTDCSSFLFLVNPSDSFKAAEALLIFAS
ncbi:MAG TPA: hypothetical protein VFT23_03895 [Burkholderiales bacterium]|nr:hypothetical protein [Burkholderiales bacterium]